MVCGLVVLLVSGVGGVVRCSVGVVFSIFSVALGRLLIDLASWGALFSSFRCLGGVIFD